MRTDERRIAGEVAADDPTCNNWANVWKGQIDTDQPDIVVVQTGSWDVADRKLPGEDEWRSPGDPKFDAFALSEMIGGGRSAVVQRRGRGVAHEPGSRRGGVRVAQDPGLRSRAPSRSLRPTRGATPAMRPGKVTVVDLATWMASQSLDGGRPTAAGRGAFQPRRVGRGLSAVSVRRDPAAARELQPGPPSGSGPRRRPLPLPSIPGPAVPGGREQARAQLVGQFLPDAGVAASRAGWRRARGRRRHVRFDAQRRRRARAVVVDRCGQRRPLTPGVTRRCRPVGRRGSDRGTRTTRSRRGRRRASIG